MKKFNPVFVVCICMMLFNGTITRATNYYVNDGSLTGDIHTSAVGNNSNNGTSPASPKATLTNLWNTYGPSGTNAIASGDIIYVDAGSYVASDANLALSVSGISIIGAASTLTFFDNNQISTDANRWANITGTNITIQGIYLTGYNYGLGGAAALNISGASNITITDVEVSENASGGGSSAIVVSGGSTVSFSGGGSNCNPGAASIAGGGMSVEGNGNTVTIDNFTFSGNEKATQGGSGLYISGNGSTTVTMTNSIITNNLNTSSSGGSGIFVSGANFNMSGCCVTSNQTNSGSGPKYGGAICVARGATLVISDCSFTNNSVSNSGKGGAISINTSFSGSGSAASVSLTSCSFSGNSASSEGNHLYARVGSGNAASYTISECSFAATAQDIRQDNSASISIQNSGSPVISGSGITMINTTSPITTPSTVCPSYVGPCFTILPVELMDFSSECKEGFQTLNWSTASERNNDYFILEKADEGGNFKEIVRIDGAGTSQELVHYTYEDLSVIEGNEYYRLTQVDFDGNQEIFSTISKEHCFSSEELELSYSFGTRSVNVHVPILAKQAVQFELYNVLGSRIYGKTVYTNINQKHLIFELPTNISDGTFIARVTTNSSSKTLSILTK